MKHVPDEVTNEYAHRYDVPGLTRFAGGEDWNDGTVFRFATPSGDRLLKVMELGDHAGHGPRRLDERLDYLFFLREHDAPVIHPVRSAAGNLVERVSIGGLQFQAYAWDYVEGRQVTRDATGDVHAFRREWGATIGKMHALAQRYPYWRNSPQLDEQGRSIASYETEMDFFSGWLRDDEVRDAWNRLRGELATLPSHRGNFGFIHNDPHAHNLLLTDRGIVLLDFDVANYHWFMVDLAIAVYSEIYRIWDHRPVPLDTKKAIVDSLLEGYSAHNTLPAREIDLLELFLYYRRILMFCVFYKQILDNAPGYLEGMKRDILERNPLLADDRV